MRRDPLVGMRCSIRWINTVVKTRVSVIGYDRSRQPFVCSMINFKTLSTPVPNIYVFDIFIAPSKKFHQPLIRSWLRHRLRQWLFKYWSRGVYICVAVARELNVHHLLNLSSNTFFALRSNFCDCFGLFRIHRVRYHNQLAGRAPTFYDNMGGKDCYFSSEYNIRLPAFRCFIYTGQALKPGLAASVSQRPRCTTKLGTAARDISVHQVIHSQHCHKAQKLAYMFKKYQINFKVVRHWNWNYIILSPMRFIFDLSITPYFYNTAMSDTAIEALYSIRNWITRIFAFAQLSWSVTATFSKYPNR